MHGNQIELVMRFSLIKKAFLLYSNLEKVCIQTVYPIGMNVFYPSYILYKFHLRSAATLKVEQCGDKVKVSCLQ